MKLTAHRLVAGAVFVIVLINLLSSVAPTVSFWDCGEFIAASYSLAVPHPPGAPLYLMIGRLFSMLPLADDIGLRVNLISVLVSALTVLLLHLSIVRLVTLWRGPARSAVDAMAVYGGAAVGALAFSFSHSFWWNAVESEVYAPSLLFTALVFYLILVWLDYADVPLGNRILLLIFYLVGLSCGIHLLNILALMSITYIVAFKRIPRVTLGNFILIGLIGSIIILTIYPGIIQGLPLLIDSFSIYTVVALLILAVWGAVAAVKTDHRLTAFGLMAALLVVVGYSTFLMIKIRSGMNPFLDENDPETWKALLAYLNREQYGSESLFLTMFNRKAPFWSYQINKMYLRYLDWQFLNIPKFFGLPFLLGIVGAVHHFYRDRMRAFTVLVLFLMTGLAIVLYLNQDDPQPRERDYAYVGSFYAFAIWIGMGMTALIDGARESLKNLPPRLVAAGALILGIIVVPLNMWIKNYESHDRSGNYVAWDYSYNLLNTCAPNAILYTNGDNDTFPLWYLQVVEGIRRDVSVVNLSLLNTGWFIKQLRDREPRVSMPPKITDDYIDNTLDARDVSALIDRRWQEKRRVSVNGPSPDAPPLVWDVPATLAYPIGTGGRNEYFLRVQDFMILNILAANHWQRPIYFAVTVSDDNLLGLRDVRDPSKNYLSMEGLAFRVHPQPVPIIDQSAMADNLFNTYRYRNLNNPDVYFNDNIVRLLGNYRQAMLQLAYTNMTEAGGGTAVDTALASLPLEERLSRYDELPAGVRALTALEFMDDRIPESIIPIGYDVISIQIGRLYAQLGRPEELRRRLDALVARSPAGAQNAVEYGIYYLSEAGSPEMAKQMFQIALEANPSFENYQRLSLTWLQYGGDDDFASEILRRFINRNDDIATRKRVATVAESFGLKELALSIYAGLLDAEPNDRSALDGLVNIHQRAGEPGRAVDWLDRWLAAHPDDEAVRTRREELARSLPTP